MPWQRDRPEPALSPAVQAGRHAGLLIPLLRGVAVLAALAAGAEVWRYVLLLRSRASALDASEVAASDALEQAASWVCTLMAVAVGCFLLVWLRRVIEAAAQNAKVRPSRGGAATVLGWLLPGLNLSVPGSVLAEVEHAALGRPAGARPHPSRLLLVWWALWATNVVLGVVAVVWMFRSGVQAKADGVVLHALVDAAAAATAVVTARVVAWLTALVNPPRSIPLPRVVSVTPRASSAPRAALAKRAPAPGATPAKRASAPPAPAG